MRGSGLVMHGPGQKCVPTTFARLPLRSHHSRHIRRDQCPYIRTPSNGYAALALAPTDQAAAWGRGGGHQAEGLGSIHHTLPPPSHHLSQYRVPTRPYTATLIRVGHVPQHSGTCSGSTGASRPLTGLVVSIKGGPLSVGSVWLKQGVMARENSGDHREAQKGDERGGRGRPPPPASLLPSHPFS